MTWIHNKENTLLFTKTQHRPELQLFPAFRMSSFCFSHPATTTSTLDRSLRPQGLNVPLQPLTKPSASSRQQNKRQLALPRLLTALDCYYTDWGCAKFLKQSLEVFYIQSWGQHGKNRAGSSSCSSGLRTIATSFGNLVPVQMQNFPANLALKAHACSHCNQWQLNQFWLL